jgi:hypothetical protein
MIKVKSRPIAVLVPSRSAEVFVGRAEATGIPVAEIFVNRFGRAVFSDPDTLDALAADLQEAARRIRAARIVDEYRRAYDDRQAAEFTVARFGIPGERL